MKTLLRDFLKERAAQYAVEYQKNKAIIEEWQEAVDRLYTQIEAWLTTADPDHIIECERSRIEVSEPSLGEYSINRLNLRAFGLGVRLIPKARRTVKRAPRQEQGALEQATGRIDMTDEGHRYLLYRFGLGAEEKWYMDDAVLQSELQPLTAERFEAVLLGYLR
jgi:hypothetical protein